MVELIPNPEFERVALPALVSYRDAVSAAFVPPPLAKVRARAHRRVVVRNAALAAATASVVAAVTVGVALVPGRHQDAPPGASATTAPPTTASPTSPAKSTTPEPMPTAWGGKTVVLPAAEGYRLCPQGPVTFATGRETVVGSAVIGISETRATGDLNGDGQPEAVVYLYCRINSEFGSGDGSGHLLVITRDSAGMFIGLAHVGPDGEEYPTVRVRDGVLVATIRQRYSPQVVQERIYRWDGTTFQQVDGPTTFPSN